MASITRPSRCLRLLPLVVGLAACSNSNGATSGPGSATTATVVSTTPERTPLTGPATTQPGIAPTDATPSSASAPPTTVDATTDELTTAVRSFWDLYLELGARTTPFDGDLVRQQLSERATGEQVNRLLNYFSSTAASGYVVQGTIDSAPTVVSVDGDTALVRDCADDMTGLYRIADGSRVDTDNPLRHQMLLELRREAGVWKVAAITDEADGCTP
ncbi:MAG: hypothetical protein AB7H93_25310 [Vicinamibacterales bacterium]